MIFKTVLLSLFMSFFASVGYAQVKIPGDGSYKLAWTWEKGGGGDVQKFWVKCGPTSGSYTSKAEIPDPLARTAPIKTGLGMYFCVVTAANAAGESGPSNEVQFEVVGQLLPSRPTGLNILVPPPSP